MTRKTWTMGVWHFTCICNVTCYNTLLSRQTAYQTYNFPMLNGRIIEKFSVIRSIFLLRHRQVTDITKSQIKHPSFSFAAIQLDCRVPLNWFETVVHIAGKRKQTLQLRHYRENAALLKLLFHFNPLFLCDVRCRRHVVRFLRFRHCSCSTSFNKERR